MDLSVDDLVKIFKSSEDDDNIEDGYSDYDCSEFESIEEFKEYYKEEKWKFDLDNIVYKRIYDFKDYEFTHSIVYELVSRNFLVIILKNIIDKLTTLSYRVLIEKDFVEEEIINNIKLICKDFMTSNKVDDLLLKSEKENILDKSNQLTYSIKNLLYHELYLAYPDYSYSEMNYRGFIDDDLNSMNFISKENFINRIVFEDDKELEAFMDKVENDKDYCYNYKNCDGFVVYQAQNINHNEFVNNDNINSWSINTVYPDYTKKLKNINHTKITMNLSLPKNELISFVKKIKKEYDEENTSFAKLSDIKKLKSIPLSSSKYKQNWSDMFFIYDYISSEINKNSKKDCIKYLQILFTFKYGKRQKNKNANKNVTTSSCYYSSKTISNKYKTMCELIEQFDYMNLINKNPNNDIFKNVKNKKLKCSKSDLYKKEQIYNYLESL